MTARPVVHEPSPRALFRDLGKAGGGSSPTLELSFAGVQWLGPAALALFTAAIASAAAVSLPRKVRVAGDLVLETGFSQVVAPAPAVVAASYVTLGQNVVRDQPLVSLLAKSSAFDGTHASTRTNRELQFRLDAIASEIAASHEAETAARRSETEAATGLAAEVDKLAEEIDIAHARVSLRERELRRTTGLVAQGFLSEAGSERPRDELLTQQAARSGLDRLMASKKAQVAALHRATEQAILAERVRRLSLERQQSELRQAHTEQDSSHRPALVSPIDGVVASLAFHPGQTVTTGDTLVVLRPVDARTLLQVCVPSRHFPELAVGQTAKVRYEAYPVEVYGAYDARLISVEQAPAQTPRSEGPCYVARLQPSTEYVHGPTGKTAIAPGTRALVDIETRPRSLLGAMFAPILRGARSL